MPFSLCETALFSASSPPALFIHNTEYFQNIDLLMSFNPFFVSSNCENYQIKRDYIRQSVIDRAGFLEHKNNNNKKTVKQKTY